MNTGMVNADRFKPLRWLQKADGTQGLAAGLMIRTAVLHVEIGCKHPKGQFTRIKNLIGDPYLTAIKWDCQYCGGPCRISPHWVQRVEFEEP